MTPEGGIYRTQTRLLEETTRIHPVCGADSVGCAKGTGAALLGLRPRRHNTQASCANVVPELGSGATRRS
eukprot:248848-Prorocentrum_minimum.AAC.2